VKRIAAVVGGLLFALSAHAENLVSNPDFDQDLLGWSLGSVSGSISINRAEGLPDPPSLDLLGDAATGGIALSSCIALAAPANVDIAVYFEGETGSVSVGAIAYGDAACNIQLGTVDSDPTPAIGEWSVATFEGKPLPNGTQSVRVYLRVDPIDGAISHILFDHVRFALAGTLTQDGIPIQEGLSGTWYNRLDGGQGFEFDITDPPDPDGVSLFFGSWFTYDVTAGGPETQRWYSLQGSTDSGSSFLLGGIYRNVGGRFVAPPPTNAVAVGQVQVVFFSCTSAIFIYGITDGPGGDGRSGEIPIHRLLPNVECNEAGVDPAPAPTDFGFSGTWYNPSTGGQGLMIEVNPASGLVFLGWYTYALNGGADVTGQRWLSAQSAYDVGSRSMSLEIYVSTGGVFDANAGGVTTTRVGTATLTFTSCTTATFTYDLTQGELAGQFGSIELTRLGAPLRSCPFPQ
jgi:hypothetical protein